MRVYKLPKIKFPKILSFKGVSFLLVSVLVLSLLIILFLSKSLNLSKAGILLQDRKLTASLKIAEKDDQAFKEFLRNLGVQENLTGDITLTVDETTAGQLQQFLPQDTVLKISGKSIEFSSDNLSFFEIFTKRFINSGEELQSAQNEGSLKVKDLGEGKFEIEIDNPEQVINSATLSGKLKISKEEEASGIWQSFAKLAKIKVRVGPHSLWGVVTLR